MKEIVILFFWFVLLSFTRLFAADAPVTSAGNVANAVPGTSAVSIPVSITGFTNIGQLTLNLSFDTTLVRFVSAATNPALAGLTVTYAPSATNTLGKLVFSWTGTANVSLNDGELLADLTFSYVTGTGLLSWVYSSGLCKYKRYVGGILTALNDSPQYAFYKNGGISNRGAPVVFAPVRTVTSTGSQALPLTVNGFSGISAFTLNLEYDPAIMTYQSFTKNVAFNSSFQVGNVTGSGGKMLIVIQWYNSLSPVTLTTGATLCTLNFNYIATNSSGTTLMWFDNVPSCQYNDSDGAVLIDLPKSNYYHDGLVAPPMVSIAVSPSANPVCGGVPVTFSATAVNGGTTPVYQWKVNGTNTGTGSVTYTYTPVNNDMVTCALTSSAAFVGGNPAISNQVIMGVNSSPVMVADFSADKLTPAKSDTVLFTDLSTAGAISWSWSFDRPDDVVYLNGTTDHSQNPQVKFTDGGLFTAALATTNGCTSDTRTKTGYIRAGIPGLWSGNTSGDWSVLSNWDDFLEPDGSTDVIIPSSALNWPVFDGNLTLGVNCRSLILSDPTSQMTIIGDLTIP